MYACSAASGRDACVCTAGVEVEDLLQRVMVEEHDNANAKAAQHLRDQEAGDA